MKKGDVMKKSLIDRVREIATKENLIEAFERHGIEYSLNQDYIIKKNLINTFQTKKENSRKTKGFSIEESKSYNLPVRGRIHKKKVVNTEQKFSPSRELVA